MRPFGLFVFIYAGALALSGAARADIVLYLGSKPPMVLEGVVDTSNNARTLTLKNKNYGGDLILSREECRVFKKDVPQKKIPGQLAAGIQKKDVEDIWDVAKKCIRYGATKEFFLAVKAIAELDPDHAPSRSCRKLRELINVEIPETDDEEVEIRKHAKSRKMKVARSYHFILLYDTSEKPEPGRKKPRHQMRLDLMERVYKTFLAFFYTRGVELEVPKKRLRSVLFNEQQDFKECSAEFDPGSPSPEGFWVPKINTSFFFDHSTSEEFLQLKRHSDEYSAKAKQLDKEYDVRDLVRFAKALAALTKILREELDLSTVSHEATHQMAGSTGLLPMDAPIPVWVHEGLATYFETPKDASWSGVGAINEDRLKLYRATAKDPAFSNIEFIAEDECFTRAANHETFVHGYGQSWALTHFLMERHTDQFMKYYKLVAKLGKSDMRVPPKELGELFDKAFDPKKRSSLNAEWRIYMNGLKTELETAIGKE